MKTRSRTLRIAATLLALATTAVSAAAAADSYPPGERINPAALETGEPTTLLRVEGRTIVDGDLRIKVAAPHVTMLGRHGEDYLVVATDAEYRRWRVARVTRDGTTSRVLGGPGYRPDLLLADGGGHLALNRYTRDNRARLGIFDTTTGELVRERTFRRTVTPLDFGVRRMVLSEWGANPRQERTFWWNPFTNAVVKITDKPGYIADITAGRLGLSLGDPYQGGCQEVVRLSAPRTRLWHSCRDSVQSFSPAGKRMVTAHILTDGPGPFVVQVRGARGRVLDTYRSKWFGLMGWESDRHLVLQAAGPRNVAMTRCTLSSCERVTRLWSTKKRDPWMAMPEWSFAKEPRP